MSLKASNLVELLEEVADFGLVKEENGWVIKCCSCEEFLSSVRVSFSSSFRVPSGKTDGSLATGLFLSNKVYQQTHGWQV